MFSGKKGQLKDRTLALAPKGYAIYVKDDRRLEADDYEILLTINNNDGKQIPVMSVTAEDPLGVAGEVVVEEPVAMTPVEGKGNTFRATVPYLPEFGYDIRISSLPGTASLTLHSERPGNHHIEIR